MPPLLDDKRTSRRECISVAIDPKRSYRAAFRNAWKSFQWRSRLVGRYHAECFHGHVSVTSFLSGRPAAKSETLASVVFMISSSASRVKKA
jgi:hypothetical protein